MRSVATSARVTFLLCTVREKHHTKSYGICARDAQRDLLLVDTAKTQNKKNMEYVNKSNEQTVPAPLLGRGSTLINFVVECDRSAMQAQLDREVNAPLLRLNPHASQYWVFSNRIFLAWQWTERIEFQVEEFRRKGYVPEAETNLFVPVVRYQLFPPKLLFLGFWVPGNYLVVDNCMSLITGRESYGFPKVMGTVSPCPEEPKHPGSLTTTTRMWQKYGYDQPLGEGMLWSIQQEGEPESSDSHGRVEEFFHALWDAIFKGTIVFPPMVDHVIDHLLALVEPKIYVLFLKQFRDIINQENVCYQGVVATTFNIDKFLSAGINIHKKGQCNAVFTQADSCPVVNDLGIKGEQVENGWSQSVGLSFWMRYDWTLNNGIVFDEYPKRQ
jgi:hypothetical protein